MSIDPYNLGNIQGDPTDFVVWNPPGAPVTDADMIFRKIEEATTGLLDTAVSYITEKKRGPKAITRSHLERARQQVLAKARRELGLPAGEEDC